MIRNNYGIVDNINFVKILSLVNMPLDEMLIALHNTKLLNNSRGETIPRKALEYIEYEPAIDTYLDEKWSYLILISPEVCLLSKEFPAYFTYILGHEIGHAIICSKNIDLHVLASLIYEDISEASNGKVSKVWQLPQEAACDRHGIYLAESIYSPETIHCEFNILQKRPECKDRKWIKQLLTLKGSNDFEKVENNIIRFSLPYKDKLIKIWERKLQENLNNGIRKSIYSWFSSYEKHWMNKTGL